ncbi:ATP-binding protein [Roseomonas mucosa]|uniref:ATP-binding protein n=1 Tax=Roseomonas mucosa TaxID=207340 RepID=UPI0030CA7F50
MSMLDAVIRGATPKPPRLMIYGTHGIGKTSLAAGAEKPIFIQTEDGADELDVARFPLATSFTSVIDAIGDLFNEEHDFRTVVIDTADWLERLVWQETCRTNGWKSIEEPSYGRGYAAAIEIWKMLLDGLNALRDERKMTVVLLAHSEIRRFDNPETEGYDRYIPKLHKSASALLQEHCDAVLFANWRVSVVKADAGFNRKVSRGAGGGARILYAEERPSAVAKNRYGMPGIIQLPDHPAEMWNAMAVHIPYFASSIPNLETVED